MTREQKMAMAWSAADRFIRDLKQYRNKLTTQQLRTIRSVALAGDIPRRAQGAGDDAAGGKAMTQNERILRHLNDYGSITALDALREYGCMRLGARIWDLKHQGHDIRTTFETAHNRYGEKVSYARYTIQ